MAALGSGCEQYTHLYDNNSVRIVAHRPEEIIFCKQYILDNLEACLFWYKMLMSRDKSLKFYLNISQCDSLIYIKQNAQMGTSSKP